MINMDIMHTVFGDNPEAIHRYIKKFIQKTAEILIKVESGIKDQNSSLLMDYFHQLKGPAGSSGFTKIYQLCEKAEEEVTEKNWDVAKEICHKISETLAKLEKELEKKISV